MRARVLAASLVAACLTSPAWAEGSEHVVQPGETLWQIAAAISGNPHRWPELYRANRDQIKDPATLYPGQRLSIPDGIRDIAPRVAEEPRSPTSD